MATKINPHALMQSVGRSGGGKNVMVVKWFPGSGIIWKVVYLLKGPQATRSSVVPRPWMKAGTALLFL